MTWPGEPASSSRSLSRRFGLATLGELLLPRESWRPFPTVGDRVAWSGITSDAVGLILRRAEADRGRSWPVLPARLYAEYSRTGDRARYESAYRERRGALHRLVLAECLAGSGRFLDDIVDLVWVICEETSWSYPATSHPPRLDAAGAEWDGSLPDPDYPVVDLFAAETGSSLAWTGYLLAPVLGDAYPRVPARIAAEVRRRLLVPYSTIDEWRWLRRRADGRPPSNWNAWIHSNLLAAGLVVEDDPYARAALVARIVRGLDAFVDGYGDDGGCDEGISYFWQAGARLFECLDLLAGATGGKIDPFDHPKIAEMARFPQRMLIGGDRYVNVGDGASRQRLGGELLYRFGGRVGDAEVQAHAVAMRDLADPPALDGRDPLHRSLAALFDVDYAEAPSADPPMPRDSWLPDIQVLTTRSAAGSTNGLFFAAKGGHNGESHGHNDVGSFMVGLDGVPVLIDVGVGVYTRATFSGERFGIWTMQSAFHNVPVIDGIEQEPGPRFMARAVGCDTGDDTTSIEFDLAGAYPARAGVIRWIRRIELDRPAGEIILTDHYELDHRPDTLAMPLMSWSRPEPRPEGLAIPAGPGRSLLVSLDPERFEVTTERIPIDDHRLADSWGDAVHRSVLEVMKPGVTGTVRVTMRPLDAPSET